MHRIHKALSKTFLNFTSHNRSVKKLALSSSYRWRIWGLERLCDLPNLYRSYGVLDPGLLIPSPGLWLLCLSYRIYLPVGRLRKRQAIICIKKISANSILVPILETIVRGWFPIYHQALFRRADMGALQFNSCWHSLPKDTVISHRLRAQSYKTAPHTPIQVPMATPVCHLGFWPTSYRMKVPTTPILVWINLLERFTELRETFYLLGY